MNTTRLIRDIDTLRDTATPLRVQLFFFFRH